MNALDYFILVSLLFVFGTIVEFALVLLIKQTTEIVKKRRQRIQIRSSGEKERRKEDQEIEFGKCQGLFKELSLNARIDFAAFLIFNIGYAVFIFVYYTCYY